MRRRPRMIAPPPRNRLAALGVVGALACAASACVSELDAPGGSSDDVDGPVTPPPPPGPPPPTRCDTPDAAAVPVLPRTSTHEFQHVVSDLLGEPVDAAAFARWTPLAKVWGFDTMTEARIDEQTFDAQWETTASLATALASSARVASVCPAPTAATPFCALHETYSAAGQYAGQQGADCWRYLDATGANLTFVAARNRWEGSALIWDTGLHPGSAVDVMRRWTAPLDGTVTLTGSVGDADPGGGDGVTVVIRRAGTELLRVGIPNGSAAVSLDDAFPEGLVMRRGEPLDVIVERGASDIYDTTALTLNLGFVAAPSTSGLTWENCGAPALMEVGSRAYRRPLRTDELADLQQVFTTTMTAAIDARIPAPFHEGLTAALQTVLMSPHVHYKPELVPGGFAPGEEHYRRAARLALYFRGSFPDDTLWSLAERQQLATDESVAAEARRLLRADAARFVDGFAGQWLDFRAPIAGAPEDALQTAMRREAHDVFAGVLKDGLPPTKLINPGFTVVDDALAGHYGFSLPGQGGPVRIDTDERGGLFTQGHFLTSTARGTDFRRVIHRGLWTLTRALCQSVPELDPATREEINGSVGQIDPTTPLGEQMQIHRNSSERCNSCHAQMDPLGLSLERYDAQGLYRERYADGSAIENDFDFHGTPMKNPDDLAAFIAGSGEFQRCVAEKLLTFGLHRAPREEEACLIDNLAAVTSSSAPSLEQMTIDAFVTSLRLTELP